MKTLLVTVASLVCTIGVICNAYLMKRQFYPTVVYITRSGLSMGVIYFQAFIIVSLVAKLFRFMFFGQLRDAELEHLIERSWYAIMETCLAFAIFRDDLSPKFIALFTVLLFVKCFHWLAEDRVDYMERSPNITLLFHIRVISLLSILALVNMTFVTIAYHATLAKGASVQLVFGFEYAILSTVVVNILMKYCLHCYDMWQADSQWDNKGVYLLYSELVLGFSKVILYCTFITIMMKIYTFPLFALRPTYLAMRSFKKALNDVIMSRRAIRNMNTLYPNATADDLAATDNVCIICREEMSGNGSAKKLPCNHIFHVSCLRNWFQRQQTCPTCRMNVLRQQQPQQQRQPQQQQQQQQQRQAQHQQQQGQQQQPQAAINPLANAQLLFATFNPFINFANALNQQQQQQQQQQAATTTSTTTTTTTNSSQSSSTTQASTSSTSSQQQMLPPLPFMNFPFMPPPFLPLPPMPMMPMMPTTLSNLQNLSEQELRVMEGSERSAVEARIRCLQNIKNLLDTAVGQLQQYYTIVNRPNTDNSNVTETEEPSSTTPSAVNKQQEPEATTTTTTATTTTTTATTAAAAAT